MVLECVWPFFENPSWLEPVCEYFRSMGYGVTIRKEQASNYLAQVRTRGVLTATRADHWEQAMGPLRDEVEDEVAALHMPSGHRLGCNAVCSRTRNAMCQGQTHNNRSLWLVFGVRKKTHSESLFCCQPKSDSDWGFEEPSEYTCFATGLAYPCNQSHSTPC